MNTNVKRATYFHQDPPSFIGHAFCYVDENGNSRILKVKDGSLVMTIEGIDELTAAINKLAQALSSNQ